MHDTPLNNSPVDGIKPINFETIMFFLCTLVAFGTLAYLHVSHRLKIKTGRAAVYNDCLSLFTQHRVVQDDVDYPVLSGQYQGYRVELKLIADHVGYRKVPSLWLQASVFVSLPLQGVIDYLVRPQNVEFFSPSDALAIELPLPAHWPQFATLRTDMTEGLPPLQVLDSPVELFEDPAMKELLLTPRGTRLVRQVDQARRREYLVLRAASFAHDRLEPGTVAQLLDTQIVLIDSLINTRPASPAMPPLPPGTTGLLQQVQHA